MYARVLSILVAETTLVIMTAGESVRRRRVGERLEGGTRLVAGDAVAVVTWVPPIAAGNRCSCAHSWQRCALRVEALDLAQGEERRSAARQALRVVVAA